MVTPEQTLAVRNYLRAQPDGHLVASIVDTLLAELHTLRAHQAQRTEDLGGPARALQRWAQEEDWSTVDEAEAGLRALAPWMPEEVARSFAVLGTAYEPNGAEEALDKIARLSGCPEWDYPAQVYRDVQLMRRRMTWAYAARLELKALNTMEQATARPQEMNREIAAELVEEALSLYRGVLPPPGERAPTREELLTRVGLGHLIPSESKGGN